MDEKINGSLEFVHVRPDEIGEYWDQLRPGMIKVNKHGGDWRIEDIYVAVKTQQAVLHVIYSESEYVGFVLTTQVQAWDGVVLHVWAAYSVDDLTESHMEIMRQLREWAVNIGAKRLTFHSSRRGWYRLGEKLGFRPTMQIYECEV